MILRFVKESIHLKNEQVNNLSKVNKSVKSKKVIPISTTFIQCIYIQSDNFIASENYASKSFDKSDQYVHDESMRQGFPYFEESRMFGEVLIDDEWHPIYSLD
jgi:hypothetical protein